MKSSTGSFIAIREGRVIFLNQSQYLLDTYKVAISGCVKHEKVLFFAPKNCYFVATEAHIKTSSSESISDVNHHGNKNESVFDTQINRVAANSGAKRKRNSTFNQGEIDLMEYHTKIKSHLISAAEAVHDQFFKKPTGGTCIDQETVSKSIYLNIEDHQNCSFVSYFHHLFAAFKLDDAYNFMLDKMPPLLLENNCVCSRLININKTVYLLPAQCKFLCSDISVMDPLINDCRINGKYSCIVMDPPWENKSVKRSKRYSTLSFDQIADLPIDELCQDGCLIIVWVTNKQKISKWVKKDLFKKWNVLFLTEWHWVKLTACGEPVFPWDSMHKKPYETLLLGCYKNCSKLENPTKLHNLVICSVPSTIHSHKPSLCELINKFVKQSYEQSFRCLELFARNLTPGWTSWGNEVLMMQNVTYFEQS